MTFFRKHAAITLPALASMMIAVPHAAAVDLPPGAAVILPGSIPPGGAILHDRFIDFEIRDPADGATLFAGTVRDRVIRKGDGTLVFNKRILDTLVDTPGCIVGVTVGSYPGLSTNVDYDITMTFGDAPALATRTVDGSTLMYSFASNPIYETEESKWFFADTDADAFSLNGQMTLTLGTGESTSIDVATPVLDDTPPIGTFIAPTPFQCICDGITVTGTAYDPDGTYDNHFLEYRALAAPTWTFIGQSFVEEPPAGGPLFFWDTSALTQGYYFLRLTVENLAGLTTSVITIVWVDQQFDNFNYASPQNGQVFGGSVCPSGTINDHCEEEYVVQYSDGGPFLDVDPGMPIYPGPKINQTFAVWDSTTVADGSYSLLVRANDTCGHQAGDTREIIIDNTPPTTLITSPVNCQCVEGMVQIFGTVDDANLAGWTLQYTGGNVNGWVTINSGTDPVSGGLLGTWDTTNLPDCPYVIRLIASDTSIINCNGAIHNQSEFLVSVTVGCEACPGDFNNDGVVNAADLAVLLGAWGLCP